MDNDEERKSNKTSVNHEHNTVKPMEYTHIREIMEGHSGTESENPNSNVTLPTELLMTQDIAALSEDVNELIQRTGPHEHEYEYGDEEEEDEYKDSNSEGSGNLQQDDQSIPDTTETSRMIDLLAESQAVITVKDMYTDWNLKAEHSKNLERDISIWTPPTRLQVLDNMLSQTNPNSMLK